MIANSTRIHFMLLVSASFALMASSNNASFGQMINVQTPLQSNRDSYYERQGIGFGLSLPGSSKIRGLSPAGQILPNVQLTQGSFGQAIPGFGGYRPNSSLRTGFTTGSGLSLGLEMGKGFRRSSVSQAPSVTMMNGGSASIFSGSLRPFVTRIDPVLGAGLNSPRLYKKRPATEPVDSHQISPGASYESSTASQGDMSVRDIKNQKLRAQEQQDQALRSEINDLISAAAGLEAEGKYGAARAKYGRALRMTRQQPGFSELGYQLSETLKGLRNKR